MRAAYDYVARYDVTAACTTPLRTGGIDGDPETVLRDSGGRALIQASSIAGALKNWLKPQSGTAAENLFGSRRKTGRLVVSDGVFDSGALEQTRPRLRINGKTGSADSGGKFDVAHMAAGSKFAFSLWWLGEAGQSSETKTVERLLSALHSGQICLGAQKTNGFGRVTLKVNKRTFDLTDPKDRNAWLEDEPGGEPLPMRAEPLSGMTVFTVEGHADRILVKGASRDYTGAQSVTRNLEENGVPILPGSSVKGAVRARAASIARCLNLPDENVNDIFGREARKKDNGKAGLVRFEDVKLTGGKKQQITRIRINRFTGGVMRGGLFQEEPLQSGVNLRIAVPAGNAAACGLIACALRDLGLNLYNLGSGGAIGWGYIKVKKIKAETPDGRAAVLEFSGAGCQITEGRELFEDWLNALGGAAVET